MPPQHDTVYTFYVALMEMMYTFYAAFYLDLSRKYDLSKTLNGSTVSPAYVINVAFECVCLICRVPCVSRSLSVAGSDSSRSEEKELPSWCRTFLRRVLWVSLPVQLLLLLLVALACLVPMSEEDYSCSQSNNFAHSFHPMLSYTNGPPPM